MKRDISLDFARRALSTSDIVGIRFIMAIDSSQSTRPFASIVKGSFYKDREDEVVFVMNIVFRILNIEPMNGNHRLFQVDLILTSDNDNDLHALTDRIPNETFPGVEGWYRLGLVLLKIGQSDKAQQVYAILWEQAAEEDEKALEIYEKTLPPDHPNLASSYGNIGWTYMNIGEHSNALTFFEKKLAIQQQSLPTYHADVASSYNKISNLYYNMDEYLNVLSSYETALEIQQQSFPPNHPDLGISFNNIGPVHENIGNYVRSMNVL